MSWFCKHDYEIVGTWNCRFKFEDDCIMSVPMDFLVCKKCGKRKLLKDKDCYYNNSVLRRALLWEKGQLSTEEFDFEE